MSERYYYDFNLWKKRREKFVRAILRYPSSTDELRDIELQYINKVAKWIKISNDNSKSVELYGEVIDISKQASKELESLETQNPLKSIIDSALVKLDNEKLIEQKVNNIMNGQQLIIIASPKERTTKKDIKQISDKTYNSLYNILRYTKSEDELLEVRKKIINAIIAHPSNLHNKHSLENAYINIVNIWMKMINNIPIDSEESKNLSSKIRKQENTEPLKSIIALALRNYENSK